MPGVRAKKFRDKWVTRRPRCRKHTICSRLELFSPQITQFLKTLPRLSPRTGQGRAPEVRLRLAGYPPAVGAHPQSLSLEVFNREYCNTTRDGHRPAHPVRGLRGHPGKRNGPASAEPRRSRPTQCDCSRADADRLSRLRRFQFPDQTPHLLATPGHGPADSPAKNGAGASQALSPSADKTPPGANWRRSACAQSQDSLGGHCKRFCDYASLRVVTWGEGFASRGMT